MSKTLKNFGIGCGAGTLFLIIAIIGMSLLASMCSVPQPEAGPATEIIVVTSEVEPTATRDLSTPTNAPPAPTYTNEPTEEPSGYTDAEAAAINTFINDTMAYANDFAFLFNEIAAESNKAANDPYTYFLSEDWIINYGALGYAVVETANECQTMERPPEPFGQVYDHFDKACVYAEKAGNSIVNAALDIADMDFESATVEMSKGTEYMIIVTEETTKATSLIETISDQLP